MPQSTMVLGEWTGRCASLGHLDQLFPGRRVSVPVPESQPRKPGLFVSSVPLRPGTRSRAWHMAVPGKYWWSERQASKEKLQ